jgi:hypothetical protein
MTDFKPPIATRTTEELLQIVGAPDKWNVEAVDKAMAELKLRNIPHDKIRHAEYLSKKADKIENLKRANESFSILDFIFEPVKTLFEVIISWELEKDGYLKKAKQQKRLRLIFGFLILGIILYLNLR